MSAEHREPWVRVKITERESAWQREQAARTDGLPVTAASSRSPLDGCHRRRYTAVAVRAWLVRPGALALLAGLLTASSAGAQSGTVRALPVLTTVQEIRALSQDQGAKGYPVRVRAIVTHSDEIAHGGLMIHDGAFGQFVVAPADIKKVPAWLELQRGDLIEIEGRTVRGGFAPNVEPAAIRRIGRAPLPRPKHIAYSAMLTGRHDCDYVEIAGVVQRAWLSSDPSNRTLFMDVAYGDGLVRTTYWDYTPGDLSRFIDARVRLRGNVGTLFGPTEQLRGVSLFVGHTRDITVLEPAPDPFSLPTRTIRSLYNYSADGEANRRIRVRGVVTCYVPGHAVEVSDFTSTAKFRHVRHVLYVDDGSGGARIETEQPQRVRPGAIVEVVGFPAVTPGKPIVTNAVFKIAGQAAAEPSPLHIGTTSVMTPENDAALVHMEGNLLSLLRNPTDRILVLKVGETVFEADLPEDAGVDVLERIRPGSLVAVTGVYSYRWGPPPSFRLFLRSPADIVLVSASPWWTFGHTMVMLVLLGLGAGGAGIWVRATADRKRQQFQAVLTERTRVGRELHDTLEQGLTGIALQLEAVSATLQASPEAAQQSLDVARQMLRYSIEETRRSVMDLRSQALESRDLVGALENLARQMTGGTPVLAEVRVEGTPQRLDAAHEHHLLRIGLEALTNALKHSGARHVDIVVRFEPDATTLSIIDDGCGLGHGAQDMPGMHFGLQGIRERADKIGGVLHIDSARGSGTRLSVSVPAERRTETGVPPRVAESWRTN
jgi:signal transduction histidine kinase